jgi:hypothetical protein
MDGIKHADNLKDFQDTAPLKLLVVLRQRILCNFLAMTALCMAQ